MNLKVYIETYGCQMNINDSQVAASLLCQAGCSITENMEEADVILVNTCSVRDNAEQRVLGRLEVFNLQKKKKRGVVVGVLGCMAQRLKDKLLENKSVDFAVGPDSYRNLPTIIKKAVEEGERLTDTKLSFEETYADIEPVRTDSNGVSAFISIARGCNNVCSFCIVPFTRGRERSRDPKSIVREAEYLFASGYKEVTLLGQNVDSYEWVNPDNPTERTNFFQLLELVALIDPNLRVRFQTSHPKDIRRGVLYTMAMYPNICKHIHLPVQSGSNAQLEKMHRSYTVEEYLSKIEAIREILPDCAITTDIISGFCDETEQDHRQTLELMKKVRFDSAFMFQYSERPNTLAARKFPDNVPASVKTARLNEIIALQNQLSLESNQKCVGKTFEVLVEGTSKRSDTQMMGRTEQNKACVFDAQGAHPGDYVDVEITGCTSATLIGHIVPRKKDILSRMMDMIELPDFKAKREEFKAKRDQWRLKREERKASKLVKTLQDKLGQKKPSSKAETVPEEKQ